MARVFLTGSPDVLGLMAGQVLAGEGHQVVLHARNGARAADARAALPGAEHVVTGDLSAIAGIREQVILHRVAGRGLRRPHRREASGPPRGDQPQGEQPPRGNPMKAVVFTGTREVALAEVADATLEEPADVLLRVTSSAICGTDLHMYDGRTGATPGLAPLPGRAGRVAPGALRRRELRPGPGRSGCCRHRRGRLPGPGPVGAGPGEPAAGDQRPGPAHQPHRAPRHHRRVRGEGPAPGPGRAPGRTAGRAVGHALQQGRLGRLRPQHG